MNSFALATEISWTLQSAIAVTFAVALAGLAVHLKRPGTSGLAVAWAWTTLGLSAVAVESFVDSTGARPWPTLIFGGLTLAGIGGSIPAFEASVDALSGVRDPLSLRALLRRSLGWSFIGLLTAALLVGLANGPFEAVERFVGLVGRVFIVVLYVRLTFHVLASRRTAGARFTGVLAIFACATLVQALRPLLVLLLFRGQPIDASISLETPAAIAFIGFHVFAGTMFGVACVLLALAEERETMLATGRQLRDAELRLERSHRFESIGRLASGVAHDFNNLLTVISSSAELARQAPLGSKHLVEELREIEKAAARGADLTQQLLAFARRQPQSIAHFDMGERVQLMSSLLERLVGPQITLSVVVHPQCTMVEMDPVRFEQVVLNLVANARDALPTGGRVIVSTSLQQLAIPRSFRETELPAGRYACLTVSDTGTGIAPDVMANLFEPFFTTRHDEGGSGLGLATVHGIISQASGGICVESTPGQGAIFTVYIPSVLTGAGATRQQVAAG